MTTLVLVFKEIESEDKTKFDNFYSSLKAEIIISESDTVDVIKSIYTTVITHIQKPLEKVSGWIIDSVTDHTISISKYNSLAGSSYIKLPMKLIKNLPKGLILKTLIFQSKLKTFTKSKTRILSALVFLVMKIKKNIQSVYQKNIVKKNKKTCSFIINRKKRKETLCSYQRF